MKTHKVIDLIYRDDEYNVVFIGTYQECMDWKSNQGFGYMVLPLSKIERSNIKTELDEISNIRENM